MLRGASVLVVIGAVRAQCPMNCSENGVCMDSLCECDDGWSGKGCEELMLDAVSFPQGYGSKRKETAWGAGVLKRFDLYHMFVTTMEDCRGSSSVSLIEHAVSANATGPYELKNVAVSEMASSPTPLVLPDGTFALFQGGAVAGTGRACRRRAEEQVAPMILASSSLDGPWKSIPSNIACKDPAPMVHINGTIYMLCGATLYRGSLTSDWVEVARLPIDQGPPGNYTEPFMYLGRRMTWHVIYRVQAPRASETDCNPEGTVSAHAFSTDGLYWQLSRSQPYKPEIALTNHTSITAVDRISPKFVHDEHGHMTHLVTGVRVAPTCAGNDGLDEDGVFTLIQPIHRRVRLSPMHHKHHHSYSSSS